MLYMNETSGISFLQKKWDFCVFIPFYGLKSELCGVIITKQT